MKKLLIAAIAIAVGVGVVSGTRLGNHLKLKWTKANQWVQEQVPLEDHIESLKMQLANLSKEDDRYVDQVARQKLQVAKLRTKVTDARAKLEERKAFVQSLSNALAAEGETVSVGTGSYSRKQAEENFLLEARTFVADKKIVEADEENLKIAEEILNANMTKLAGLAVQRKDMEAEILVLEREVAKQKLQDQRNLTVDDSAYGKLQKQIEEAKERFQLQQAKSQMHGESVKGSIRAQEEKKVQEKKEREGFQELFAPKSKVTSR